MAPLGLPGRLRWGSLGWLRWGSWDGAPGMAPMGLPGTAPMGLPAWGGTARGEQGDPWGGGSSAEAGVGV